MEERDGLRWRAFARAGFAGPCRGFRFFRELHGSVPEGAASGDACATVDEEGTASRDAVRGIDDRAAAASGVCGNGIEPGFGVGGSACGVCADYEPERVG